MIPLLAGDLRPRPPTSRTRLFSRVALFDIAWAGISPLLAFLVRDGTINRLDLVTIYCAIALVVSLVAFQWFKISAPIAGFFSVHDASKIAQACLVSVALTTVVLFTFTRLEDAPRSIPIIHLLVLAGGLFFQRALYRIAAIPYAARRARSVHGRAENILIVEASRLAWFFSKMVEEFSAGDVRIVAILDERSELHHRSLNGYSIIGAPAQLAKIIDEYATHGVEIHKVVMATHPDSLRPFLWEDIQRTCAARHVGIEWLYDRFLILPQGPTQVGDLAPAYEQTRWIGSGPYWAIKRLLDVAIAAFAMIIAAPLALAVALLVFIDVGHPIVFWQQRIGHRGRSLHVYKFRTMRANFDRHGRRIAESGRTSPLGRLLRRNRLDEIPQLFNILTGGMSLVGPRPLLPVDQPKNVSVRLQVRPGLTGLAQINGGKLLSPEEKDALDEWYVQHASLWLDAKIIVRTFIVIMRGDRRNEPEISAALAERSLRAEPTTRPAVQPST